MEARRLRSRGALATLAVALLCGTVAAPATANRTGPAKKTKRSDPAQTRLRLASGSLRVAAPHVVASTSGPIRVHLTVTDARGTGAGWTLRVVSARTVPVAGIVGACAADSTCTLPEAGRSIVRGAVLRAARASGMGVMRFTVTLGALPAGTPRTPVSFAVS